MKCVRSSRVRALEAVAEDHQELDLRQVLRRQGIHVHREVGDDAGGLEDRSQALLDVAGLVGLVADQDQRMGPGIRRGRDAAVERGDRDGQLPVDVLDVLGGRGVVGHPGEAVGGEADLVAEAGVRPALGDVVADLPAELGQEPALAGEQLGAAPRAEPGDDPRRRERLQPAQGRDPLLRVAAGQRGARAVHDQRAGEEHRPGPAGRRPRPPGPRPDRAAGSRPATAASPIGVRSARACRIDGVDGTGGREQPGRGSRVRSRRG